MTADPAVRELLVLTGHTRGLGAALLHEAVALGMDVVALGRRALDPAPGGRVQQIVIDLADHAGAAELLAEALAARDLTACATVHLVANAGVLQPIRRAGDLGTAAIAEAVAVNLTTPLVLTDALLRATAGVAAERRITLVSSGAGTNAYAGWSVYGATKAGLDHFARAVALDAPPRTRISSVAPGVIDTDMQAEIRASDPAHFPQRPRFDVLARDGALLAPRDVAARLLAHARSTGFGTEPVVDLRRL